MAADEGKFTATVGSDDVSACRTLLEDWRPRTVQAWQPCSDDPCNLLACAPGTYLVANSTGYRFHSSSTSRDISAAQSACCLASCNGAGGLDSPCACAGNEFQTADLAVSAEPFTGACEACGQSPPSVG